MKNDMKLPNFTFCRTCKEFFCLFIYFECGFLKFNPQENSRQNVKWVVTIAMKFLKERRYFLLVMFLLTSSSLPRKIPIKTDYPSIPSNRSLKELCHKIQPN